MAWDVLFYDETTQTAYRLRAKRLSVGDGIAADSLQDEIALRDDVQGRRLLVLSGNYPLMRYGTAAAECAPCPIIPEMGEGQVPVFPDDLAWQSFDLTELAFFALTEYLMLAWIDAILNANPHRDLRYERLKKNLEKVAPVLPSVSDTPANGSGESAPVTTSPAA